MAASPTRSITISAGAIGSLITSGTVNGLSGTFSGLTHSGSQANIDILNFSLVAPVTLAAGTYWLELHEGTSLTANDQTNIGWELSQSTGNALQDAVSANVPVDPASDELAFQLFDNGGSSPTPEPSTFAMLTVGLGLLGARLRRR
jgi:hypothetical protein